MNRYISLLSTFILVISFCLKAQIPEGYYDDALGLTGDELKEALHIIIKDHEEYSYNDLRDFILKETDEDPENANNVLLIHSGISRDKDQFGGNIGDWNREHVWAKSHGDFGTIPPAGSDAHHVRPADVQVNSTRSNLDFDNGGSPVNNCPGCKVDSDSFETRDDAKGDVARMIFYMAVRYEGGDAEPDLEVVDEVNTYPDPEHGKLSTLMDWHAQDPVDDFEINRNEVIYSYQENRNPFIDHPEFVEDIWGDPTGENSSLEKAVSIYPNPFTNKVFIVSSQNSFIYFSLFDMHGKIVEQGKFWGGRTILDVSMQATGIYALILMNEKGKQLKQVKLLKTKN